MDEEFSGWTFIAKAGVQVQASPGGCFGVKGSNETWLPSKNSASICHYHSTTYPDFLSYITDAV